jgi:hypothetical protein
MGFDFEIEVTADRLLAFKISGLALKNRINSVDECP